MMEHYQNVAKKVGFDFMKRAEDGFYNSPGTVQGCAMEIIRSTALREVETYYPKSHTVWWPVIKSHISPDWLKNTIKKYKS